jgi:hypothetical protein
MVMKLLEASKKRDAVKGFAGRSADHRKNTL